MSRSRQADVEGTLVVDLMRSDWPVSKTLVATGNDPIGRGARGPMPLHLTYEATNLRLEPGNPVRWRVTITASAPSTTREP
ncbi:MAG: hypothetical protein HYZ58_19440 [Acidobacteria bacterium]|nr:hypothetical protein [Acidobacteriota bacterium]